MTHNIREQLKTKFQERRQPLGFNSACQDLDVLIYEYDMYIDGIVYTYLQKGRLPFAVKEINRKEDIRQKLLMCQKKLAELQALYDLDQELIDLLLACLEMESS